VHVIIHRERNLGEAVTRKLTGYVEVWGFECVKTVQNQPALCLLFPPPDCGIAGDFPYPSEPSPGSPEKHE